MVYEYTRMNGEQHLYIDRIDDPPKALCGLSITLSHNYANRLSDNSKFTCQDCIKQLVKLPLIICTHKSIDKRGNSNYCHDCGELFFHDEALTEYEYLKNTGMRGFF